MAPIDPRNTARLFIDYRNGDTWHTAIMRPQTGVSIPTLAAWAHDWLTAAASLFTSETVFEAARYSEQNSNVTNPIDWVPIGATGSGGGDVDRKPHFGSFVGRSAQGHRVKLGFYGVAFNDDVNYRVLKGESAALSAAIDALNDLQSKIGTITGSKAVWKPYMNLGYNAYWQRKARRG